MRAAVATAYGAPDVVVLREMPMPVPKADQVVVRVRAAGVNSGDARIRGARFPAGFAPFARLAFGVRRPRRPVLGSTFSGVVEQVGTQVQGVAVGDEVAGMTGMPMGAHAEYVAVAAKRCVTKPPRVSHEDAAAVLFGGTTALRFLRDQGAVTPGVTVLVNGASGAVGSSAVQLARHFGATVTAVTSAANADLVRDLGADRVIDYRATPLAEIADRFDVVFDTVGSLTPASGTRLLTERGVLLLAVASLGQMMRARGRVKAGPASEKPADFALLLAMVADGTLRVVNQVLPLDDIVAAYRTVDSGHKVGNLVVVP